MVEDEADGTVKVLVLTELSTKLRWLCRCGPGDKIREESNLRPGVDS